MAKTLLVKHIFRNFQTRELGCWAEAKIKIPYPPYPGLIVNFGHGGVYEISYVEYNSWKKETYCKVFPMTQDYTLEKDIAKKEGWKIRELPAGKFADWWPNNNETFSKAYLRCLEQF